MVRAAIRNQVDFSQADRYDPHWQLNLTWRLQAVEQNEILEFHKFLQQRWSAYATSSALSSKSLATNMEYEQKLSAQLVDLYTGNRLKQSAGRTQATASDYRKLWSSVFGDMDDPAVQKAIQATVERLSTQKKRRHGRTTR